MKNLLITGISGFVGSYLADYCVRNEQKISIHGLDISAPPGGNDAPYRYYHADLLDKARVEALIQDDQSRHHYSPGIIQFGRGQLEGPD